MKIKKIFQLFLILDSDDSDTEGGLGNVERVVMRPPGHSGKAKRGHLCFDSSFETGKMKQKIIKLYALILTLVPYQNTRTLF